MNVAELKRLSDLRKEIDKLYEFIFYVETLEISFIKKVLLLKRPRVYGEPSLILNGKLKNDILEVLQNHLVELQKEFEKG